MTTVTATPYPLLGRVLVQVNDSDGTCIQVRRVIDATGESTPLRPYVWPCSALGEFQHLSGGYASFWDTEAPLDVAFHYESTAADTGFDTDLRGLLLNGVAGNATTPDNAALDITGDLDVVVYLTDDDWTFTDFQTFASKWRVAGNQRSYALFLGPTGTLELDWSNDGTALLSATSTVPVTTVINDGQPLAVRAQLDVDNGAAGKTVVFSTGPTPNGPWTQLGAAVTTGGTTSIFNSTAPLDVGIFDSGQFPTKGVIHSVLVRTGTGVVGANPDFASQAAGTTAFTDVAGRSWTVTAPARIIGPFADLVTSSTSVTLASNGGFWLRDPVRPCHDRAVGLCFNDPDCGVGGGIFFATMDAETYAPNSFLVQPTNARRPIALARQRRDAATALTVVTSEFTDRDDVLALAEPGSPLQFVAPPAYGIPDRYMSIGNVTVTRGISDVTYSPRLIQMPYDTVDRPVGPTEGVCGARFTDQCDVYGTWAAAEASTLAWSSLIEGTAAADGFITWGQVNSGFANWTAVLAAGTWRDVRDA